MTPASPHYLRLENVAISLGGRKVLDDINLALQKGELLGLLGPSGSGKTTLLNIIGGFLSPERGAVTIAGDDVLRLPPHRRDIGITFQHYALFPHLDVFDNVAYGLRQRGVARAEIEARVGAMLDRLALGDFRTRMPRALSGGQQQRVALARALVVRPRLMLLDEPLANLDAALRKQVRYEIREILRQSAVTSVFVTHDQDEAFSLCDRVAVLNGGRIAQTGTPVELIARPADAFVAGFVGDPNRFRARVTGADGSGLLRIEANGFRAEAEGSGLAAGAEVEVFVRPEVIRLDAGSAGGGGFAIKDALHLSGGAEVLLSGPVSLRVRPAASDPIPPIGTRVSVSWRGSDAHAFAAPGAKP
jgi:putative spermidine/putrescine transport system ATP-binding protein